MQLHFVPNAMRENIPLGGLPKRAVFFIIGKSIRLRLVFGAGKEIREGYDKTMEKFRLGNMEVMPGQCRSGWLELAEGNIRLPATIFHGAEKGKTVLITAGVHAGEYVGIQAAIELGQKLKIEKVAGTIVIVKVTNLPAFGSQKWKYGIGRWQKSESGFPG